MSDIAEIGERLVKAIDRIGAGVSALEAGTGADHSEELGTLRAQLEDERTTNAQLEARVAAISAKLDDGPAEDSAAKVAAQAEEIAALDAELQALRASNVELRDILETLRTAAMDGAADAEMINTALMAEVDALKAQRGADAAELSAILSELKPVLEGA